jgi:translation initiation factor IF-3
LRVNDAIRAPQVQVIGANKENLGVIPVEQALQLAAQAGMDLIEVAPDREPPVCRILDFGKFNFEREKKEREARKAQTKIEVKEIRLRPKTSAGDRYFKTKKARGWLKDGNKVRVTIRFRGREMDYPDIALEDLKEIALELEDFCIVEAAPGMEGRTMTMVLAPGKSTKSAKPVSQPKAEAEVEKKPAETKPAETKPAEKVVEPAAKKPAEKTTETVVKKPTEKAAEPVVKKPAEKKE